MVAAGKAPSSRPILIRSSSSSKLRPRASARRRSPAVLRRLCASTVPNAASGRGALTPEGPSVWGAGRGRQSRSLRYPRQPPGDRDLGPCPVWFLTPSSRLARCAVRLAALLSAAPSPTRYGPASSSVQWLRLTSRKACAPFDAPTGWPLALAGQDLPRPPARFAQPGRGALGSVGGGPLSGAPPPRDGLARRSQGRRGDPPMYRASPARHRVIGLTAGLAVGALGLCLLLASPARQLPPQGHRRFRGCARQPAGRLRPRGRPERHRRLAAQRRLHRRA